MRIKGMPKLLPLKNIILLTLLLNIANY